MSPEYMAQPEREDGLLSAHAESNPGAPEQALDAIVYDVHPALLPRPADFYPYAARPPVTRPAYEPNSYQPNILQSLRLLVPVHVEAPTAAQYVVPRRFGMSAILGIMTALALLFGWFHWSEAHPVLYLFFGVQSLLICLAQMFYGQTPRAASAIAGAIILPIFIIAAALFSDGRTSGGLVCFLFVSVPTGAFLGYITGTMAAGVFLVMDAADAYFTGSRDLPGTHSPTAASTP